MFKVVFRLGYFCDRMGNKYNVVITHEYEDPKVFLVGDVNFCPFETLSDQD